MTIRHKNTAIWAIIFIASIAFTGCADKEAQQPPQPVNSKPTITSYKPTPITFNSSPAQSVAKKTKAHPKGQSEEDKLQYAINLFRAGEFIDDKDANCYSDVRIDPNNPTRGLEISLTPSFFELSYSERLRVAKVFYKQWLSAIKEAGVKVNPKFKANYMDATVIFVDSVDHKNAGGMSIDTSSDPVWVIDD